MDLKDFIKATVSGIIEASIELQREHGKAGVVVNPLQSSDEASEVFDPNDPYAKQRVQLVSFDIAVTVGSESAGKGSAALKIASVVDIGGGGGHSKTAQEVSRVQFSLPVALPSADPPERVEKPRGQGGRSAPV